MELTKAHLVPMQIGSSQGDVTAGNSGGGAVSQPAESNKAWNETVLGRTQVWAGVAADLLMKKVVEEDRLPR